MTAGRRWAAISAAISERFSPPEQGSHQGAGIQTTNVVAVPDSHQTLPPCRSTIVRTR